LENDAFLFICGNCAKELMPGNTILIFWKIFGFETPRHQKEEIPWAVCLGKEKAIIWREKQPIKGRKNESSDRIVGALRMVFVHIMTISVTFSLIRNYNSANWVVISEFSKHIEAWTSCQCHLLICQTIYIYVDLVCHVPS
jgi:hypothetical protein